MLKLKLATLSFAAAICTAVVGPVAPSAAAPPSGGGGGGAGTGGGTIYYVQSGVKTTWTMNSDGGAQTQLGYGTYGPVSTATYGGRRWFLDTREIVPREYSPDGYPRTEVFALRADYDFNTNNTSATRVQLTNDASFQTRSDGFYSLHWVPGGQMISIRGRRWADGAVVEGGIYTATLQFGADGDITGLVAQPAAPAIALPLGADQWPVLSTYCWNPAGTKVAYEDGTSLWVADLIGGPHQKILNARAHTPQWSPDGAKIAFTNPNVGISTIKPDGTGLKEIIRATSAWTFDRPFWSPGGTHLVCYGFARTGPYNLDLFRSASNGNFLTNLTNTPTVAEMSMGWR